MKTKKVKPVLVESESKSCKGDLVIVTQKLGIHIANTEPSYHNKQELILISLEDEKIDDSKERYFESSNGMINIITDKNVNIIGNYYNIVAYQSQLSPELIQQLVNEYNSDGMKDFEIRMEEKFNLRFYTPAGGIECCEKYNVHFKPKLTNGFVTVVKKEPILYTEEEVENILAEYSEALQSILTKNLMEVTPVRWFKQNKKTI